MEQTKRRPRKLGWRFALLAPGPGRGHQRPGPVAAGWTSTSSPPRPWSRCCATGTGSWCPAPTSASTRSAAATSWSSTAAAPSPRSTAARARSADFLAEAGHWLGLTGSDTTYVKRVIGLPGDHVVCCDADGRLTVNGQQVAEPYLYPGRRARAPLKFNVVVPDGRLWLMGDHRSVSADSRSLLGAPGGRYGPAGARDRPAGTDHLAA